MKRFLMLFLVATVLVGCSSRHEKLDFDRVHEALKQADYNEAMTLLLEEKNERDTDKINYYINSVQTIQRLLNMYKENDWDQFIPEAAAYLENDKNPFHKDVAKHVQEKLEKAQGLQKDYTYIQGQIQIAEQMAKGKKYEAAITALEKTNNMTSLNLRILHSLQKANALESKYILILQTP